MASKDFMITIENDIEQIQDVLEQLEEFGKIHKISPKTIYQLNLSVDEILTNIISYAFENDDENDIDVSFNCEGKQIIIKVSDEGGAFNPLDFETQDLDTNLEDREVGGLGIYLVKSMMDDLQYQREKNKNIVTMTKSIS